MKRSKDNKKKPPSRKRYEEAHPVFSVRVPKEIDDRIQAVKEKEGLSNTDILKVALGLIEVKVRAEEEVRREAYDEGWEKGVNEAWDLLEVTYPCSKCGEELTVDTEEEKKAIRKFMIDSGWGHTDCTDRRH